MLPGESQPLTPRPFAGQARTSQLYEKFNNAGGLPLAYPKETHRADTAANPALPPGLEDVGGGAHCPFIRRAVVIINGELTIVEQSGFRAADLEIHIDGTDNACDLLSIQIVEARIEQMLGELGRVYAGQVAPVDSGQFHRAVILASSKNHPGSPHTHIGGFTK